MRRGGKSEQKEEKKRSNVIFRSPSYWMLLLFRGSINRQCHRDGKKLPPCVAEMWFFFIENMGQVSSQNLQGGATSQNPPLCRRSLFISRLYLEVRKGSQLQSAVHTEDGKWRPFLFFLASWRKLQLWMSSWVIFIARGAARWEELGWRHRCNLKDGAKE